MSGTLRGISRPIKSLSLRLNQLSIRHQAKSTIVSGASYNSQWIRRELSPVYSSKQSLLLVQPCSLGGIATMSLPSFPSLTLYGEVHRPQPFSHEQTRGFSVRIRRKKIRPKKTKKQEHEAKIKAKQEALGKKAAENRQKDLAEVSTQHREWVEFQKSIAVQGFETGQLTEIVAGHTKTRQMREMKRIRQRIAKRILQQKAQRDAIKTGEIQALRLSDEETARIMQEAHDAMPKRAGPRRSRHKKRMIRKRFLVRKIQRKYRRQVKAAKVREELWRKERLRRANVLKEMMPEIRADDRQYQWACFQRWAEITGHGKTNQNYGNNTKDKNDEEAEEWEDVKEEEEDTTEVKKTSQKVKM